MGRCNVEALNQAPPPPAQGPAAVYVGSDGFLTQIGADGTEVRSELHDTCFSEGSAQAITVAPTNELAPPKPGQRRSAPPSAAAAERAGRAQAVPAGSTTLELKSGTLHSGTGGSGFVPGQVVVVGAGTDRAEQATVAAADGSALTLAAPLDATHDVGEVVVMVRAADGAPVDPPVVVPEEPQRPPAATDPPGGSGSPVRAGTGSGPGATGGRVASPAPARRSPASSSWGCSPSSAAS